MNVYFNEDLLPTNYWNEARVRTLLTPEENTALTSALSAARASRVDRFESAANWIDCSLRWNATPQRHNYWAEVYKRLNDGIPL